MCNLLHKTHTSLATCVATGSAVRTQVKKGFPSSQYSHQQVYYIHSVLSLNDFISKQIFFSFDPIQHSGIFPPDTGPRRLTSRVGSTAGSAHTTTSHCSNLGMHQECSERTTAMVHKVKSGTGCLSSIIFCYYRCLQATLLRIIMNFKFFSELPLSWFQILEHDRVFCLVSEYILRN